MKRHLKSNLKLFVRLKRQRQIWILQFVFCYWLDVFPPIDPTPWWHYLGDILLYLSPFVGIAFAFWLQLRKEEKKDKKIALARYIGEATKKRLISNQIIGLQTWDIQK